MYKYLALCIVLLMPGCSTAQVGRDSGYWQWTEAKSHHESIVKIRIIGQGWSSVGTGTVISDYKIITAAHVVDSATAFLIEAHNGKRYSAVIGPMDEDQDVAVIVAQSKMDIPHAKVSDTAPTESDMVEACGYGGDGELRHFDAASKLYSGSVLGLDAYTIPGDSGGPIFNKHNEIVGVISGGLAWSCVKKLRNNDEPINTTWPIRCVGLEAIKEIIAK